MKKNTSTLKKIFGYIGHYKYLLFCPCCWPAPRWC